MLHILIRGHEAMVFWRPCTGDQWSTCYDDAEWVGTSASTLRACPSEFAKLANGNLQITRRNFYPILFQPHPIFILPHPSHILALWSGPERGVRQLTSPFFRLPSRLKLKNKAQLALRALQDSLRSASRCWACWAFEFRRAEREGVKLPVFQSQWSKAAKLFCLFHWFMVDFLHAKGHLLRPYFAVIFSCENGYFLAWSQSGHDIKE